MTTLTIEKIEDLREQRILDKSPTTRTSVSANEELALVTVTIFSMVQSGLGSWDLLVQVLEQHRHLQGSQWSVRKCLFLCVCITMSDMGCLYVCVVCV